MTHVFRNFGTRFKLSSSKSGELSPADSDNDDALAQDVPTKSASKAGGGRQGSFNIPGSIGGVLGGDVLSNMSSKKSSSKPSSNRKPSLPEDQPACILPGIVPEDDAPTPKRSPKKKITLKDTFARLIGRSGQKKKSPHGSERSVRSNDFFSEKSEQVKPSASKESSSEGIDNSRSPAALDAEKLRFLQKVNEKRSVADLEKEICHGLKQHWVVQKDLLSFKDSILREAWEVVNEGFLKREFRRFRKAEASKAEMVRQSRELQTAYLREITALKDQIRVLPEGTHQACDVTHLEPLKLVDPEMRPLVEACVQERIRQFITEAHRQDSDLGNTIKDWMAKERLEWQAKAEIAEEEVKRLFEKDLAAESVLAKAERATAGLRVELNASMIETAELSHRVDELEAEVEELTNPKATRAVSKEVKKRLDELTSAKDQEVKLRLTAEAEVQRLTFEVARRPLSADSHSDLPMVQNTDLMESEPACAVDLHKVARRPLSADSHSDLPMVQNTVPSLSKGLRQIRSNSSAAELLGHVWELQDLMESEPACAVDLHKVLEQLSERLDADAMEAAFKSKPRPTAAAVELLAHRVRASRREGALLRRCCLSLAEAVLDCRQLLQDGGQALENVTKGTDDALATHKALLLESSSGGIMNVGAQEDPRRRALQAAAAVAAGGPAIKDDQVGPKPDVKKSSASSKPNPVPGRSTACPSVLPFDRPESPSDDAPNFGMDSLTLGSKMQKPDGKKSSASPMQVGGRSITGPARLAFDNEGDASRSLSANFGTDSMNLGSQALDGPRAQSSADGGAVRKTRSGGGMAMKRIPTGDLEGGLTGSGARGSIKPPGGGNFVIPKRNG